MTDPSTYAQITVTELGNGSVQYDIIPHDKTEEGAMVLLDQNGVLSARDEDGQYKPIAGTENFNIYDYVEPDGALPTFPLPDAQKFEDVENGVGITMYRNENNALVIDIDRDDGVRSQFIGLIPEENRGYEARTQIHEDEIGVGEAFTGPDGKTPDQVVPSFKI